MPLPPAADTPPSHRSKGLWLALSGGGLRAAIYHYGCLKRLHESGLLRDVAVVSATSGGAVAAALLMVSAAAGREAEDEGWMRFERKLLAAAQDGLLGPTPLTLAAWPLYGIAGVLSLMSPFITPLPVLTAVVTASAMLVHGIAVVSLDRLRSEPRRARAMVRMDPRFTATAASIAPVGVWARFCENALVALSPDRIRHFVLQHRLYDHLPLGLLNTGPRLFLIAADLSSSREMVFSSTTLAELGPAGCKALWRQDTDSQGPLSTIALDAPDGATGFRVSYNAFDIAVSTAVAASSAYPPFFAPVKVTVEGRHAGSFIDGGVVDNQALNVACRIARCVRPETAGHFPAGLVSDQISYLLAIDAGAAPFLSDRPFTSRIGAVVKRLPQILSSRQMQKAMDDVDDVERLTGVPTQVMGLRAGLPPNCAFRDHTIGSLARRIRTHFDRFTTVEIATLAYLGYCAADVWASQAFPQAIAEAPDRAASPVELMSAHIPLPAMDDASVAAHLRRSAHRFGPYRSLRRWLDSRGRRLNW